MATARRAAIEEAEQAAHVRDALMDSIRRQAEEQAATSRSLVSALQAAEVPTVEEAASQVLAAAFSIASSIMGIAMDNDDTRALSVVARAGAFERRGLIELRVSPEDYPTISEMSLDVKVIADSSLAPADFKASYPDGWIDGLLAGAIERAASEAERHVNVL